VAVAEETVCRNEVGGRVVVEAGTLDGVRGLFDGAVVNILERYFMAESRAIAAAVREGGILLASGFEPADVDPVAGVLETAGFRCLSEAFEGGWALLELERLGRR
ncbi:MAG: 50S ribosomal protein L11 methyltransferase, partial [Acidobacteriota bacterium]|nr:50S ribosomal protein L11 methyltransferase [Acidobacteriota bacterium]